jgi:hypothetical protein
MTSHVKIRYPQSVKEGLSTAVGTRIWIDGQEIRGVTSIDISHSVDKPNKVALEVLPGGLEIEYGEVINEG